MNRTDRPPCEGELVLGLGDRRADLGHAGHDGRHGAELGADGVREQPGERRLAGAGRAPQEHRREVAAADGPAERAALADEVRLAHELLEGARAQPGGERLPLGRGLEQGFGASAGHGAPGRHGPMVGPGRRQPPSGMIPVTSIRIQRTSRIASRRLAILTMSLHVAGDVGVLRGLLGGQRATRADDLARRRALAGPLARLLGGAAPRRAGRPRSARRAPAPRPTGPRAWARRPAWASWSAAVVAADAGRRSMRRRWPGRTLPRARLAMAGFGTSCRAGRRGRGVPSAGRIHRVAHGGPSGVAGRLARRVGGG